MDTRMGTLVLAAALSGCAITTYGSPVPGVAAVGTAAGSDLEAGPQTAEDRAQAVVQVTALACERAGAECAERERLTRYPYPDVQEPASQRYFVASLPQEVQSVGFELRWDVATQRYEVDRGNTLAYPATQDPGGPTPGGYLH